MSGSVLYTPLRDSSGPRSVSLNERSFVVEECVKRGLRSDGREAGETRPVRVQLNRRFCQSECSISLGASTKVSCNVRCELVPPQPSRPNEGMLNFRVDLSPMACLGWEYMAPASTGSSAMSGLGAGDESQRWWSNRILRTLERTLVNGGAVDAEALCVQSGRWVWRLHVEVVVLDAGGNLVDASVLAAISALRHFRAPAVDVAQEDESAPPKLWRLSEREPTPLPLHHSPLCVSFSLFRVPSSSKVAALVDPSWREEMVMDGLLTAAFNKHGEMCGLDFGGGCELRPSQLTGCIELAKTKCMELCEQMETALEQAQERAHQQLLEQLQKKQPQPPLPPVSDMPFLHATDEDADTTIVTPLDMDAIAQITNNAARLAAHEQEQYRLQALEYSQLHQAAKVQENNVKKSKNHHSTKNNNNNASLMAAMLHSASITDITPNTAVSKETVVPVDNNDNATIPMETSTNDPLPDKAITQTKKPNTTPSNNNHSSKKQMSTQNHNFDSDDEEVTTTLQLEFQPVEHKKPSLEKKPSVKQKSNQTEVLVNDGDDVDDLAMAVVKKKKNRKSKRIKK